MGGNGSQKTRIIHRILNDLGFSKETPEQRELRRKAKKFLKGQTFHDLCQFGVKRGIL